MGLTADDMVGIAERNKVGRRALDFSHHVAYCSLSETETLLASGGKLKKNSLTSEGCYAIEVEYNGYTFRHLSDSPIEPACLQKPKTSVCV